MNYLYFVRAVGDSQISGPYSLDYIRQEIKTGRMRPDYEAHSAEGQSYSAVKRSSEWKRLSDAFPDAVSLQTPDASTPHSSSQDPVGSRGGSQTDIAELLHLVISNQQRQLDVLSAIRWAIVGFSIWFIIQFWFLPKLLLPSR